MLIDAGRKSRMAGAPCAGIGVGAAACATMGVGTCVGFGDGTGVGLGCGVEIAVGVGAGEGVDSAAVVEVPQAASMTLTRAIQRIASIILVRIPARQCSERTADG